MNTPTAAAASGTPVLEARGLTKSFGAARVVDGIHLSLLPGRVHALVGENGAGKSTIIKMLCGVEQPDEGELLLDGEAITLHAPADAASARIATVYQELDVIDELTVAQNVMLGREVRRGPFLDDRASARLAAAALARAGSTVDTQAYPRDLSLAQQQRIVIARCLLAEARVLILDEPTAALGPHEVDDLAVLVRELTASGVSVLFVSHRLEEVMEMADEVTVLRDGRVVSHRPVAETDPARIIQEMTGRELDLTAVRSPAAAAASAQRPVVLELRGLPMRESTLDLAVHAGEIVGIAGLAGSGRTRLISHIIGDPWHGGQVIIDGTDVGRLDPARALAAGIAFLPEDRKRDGLVLEQSAPFNVSLSGLIRAGRRWTSRRDDTRRFDDAMRRMSLRGNPRGPVGRLSGGNQQKVLLARLLATDPRVIILDEPTRGVDIGAKKEIWELLEALADSGLAIVMVSSELPEILRLSDRILVVAEGQVTGEFPASTPQHVLLRAALPARERVA